MLGSVKVEYKLSSFRSNLSVSSVTVTIRRIQTAVLLKNRKLLFNCCKMNILKNQFQGGSPIRYFFQKGAKIFPEYASCFVRIEVSETLTSP